MLARPLPHQRRGAGRYGANVRLMMMAGVAFLGQMLRGRRKVSDFA